MATTMQTPEQVLNLLESTCDRERTVMRMNMKSTLLSCSLLSMSLLLAACGAKAPSSTPVATTAAGTAAPSVPSVTPSATPDLCAQASLPESVKIVNTYVHQFDNYSSLSVQVPASQLPQLIASMKGIRQALGDQGVPPCLTSLKHYALQYMDTVIQTVTGFQAKPDINALNAGIEQARKYNDQYAGELASLLGVTLGAPSGTPAAEVTDTPSAITVTNPGPNPLNLHVSPSLTSQSIGLLNANETATALGKSANGEWIQIEVPGQAGTRAWVYASLVQYTSGDPNVLPVATP